ncbi:MAG: NADPH-dependent F420 reductase [Dehalococcoidia bacterium]
MLSFIGGTGPEGLGLALRFLMAGEDVTIGSRSAERASAAAEKLRSMVQGAASDGPAPSATVQGLVNEEAVKLGDIVLITVPFDGQASILSALKDAIGNKLVVDTVIPLKFGKGVIKAIPVEEGSAAEQAQRILPDATVVSAFQNLSAESLVDLKERMDCDVVVCGDDQEAKARVMELAGKIDGIRAVDGGSLANTRYVEDFTALLLNINKIYKAHSSIKITGI